MKVIFDSKKEFERYKRIHCPGHIKLTQSCKEHNNCVDCWGKAIEGKGKEMGEKIVIKAD